MPIYCFLYTTQNIYFSLSWTYIYFLFISYFLLFVPMLMPPFPLSCLCYMLLSNPICSFPFLYFWSNLIYSLSFHYLSIAFPKVWSDVLSSIVSSYYLSFSCFYFILLSSPFSWHQTLSDPKGCIGSFSYKYFFYSIQP